MFVEKVYIFFIINRVLMAVVRCIGGVLVALVDIINITSTVLYY